MKVVILCGGRGLRMATKSVPKPMLLVDNKPIIKHIIDLYSKYGFNDFILPLGYKGEAIKQYFIDYEWRNCNIFKTVGGDTVEYFDNNDKFNVTLINTGVETMTGARIKMVKQYIGDEPFMVTYGDGLSNINIDDLLAFHKAKGKIATVTGIAKRSQYGTLRVVDGVATSFEEKKAKIGIINGGFFVFENKIMDYLSDEPTCVLEQDPMEKLVANGELSVYTHKGMWISIDTPKDLMYANEIWRQQK